MALADLWRKLFGSAPANGPTPPRPGPAPVPPSHAADGEGEDEGEDEMVSLSELGLLELVKLPGVDTTRVVQVELPAGGRGALEQITELPLPPGHYVISASDQDNPVAWITDAIADHTALWAQLVERFPTTGLWPILVMGIDGDDLMSPWLDGQLWPNGPDDEQRLAEAVLASRVLPAADGGAAPGDAELSQWPGLAPAARPSADPLEVAMPTGESGLLLVPAASPADALRVLGWAGPVNAGLSGLDQAAVVESWQQRYGAVLVSLGFDLMGLHLANPPIEPAIVRAVAREHYWFCPDNIEQGAGTLESYEPAVCDHQWLFWWD